MAYIYSLADTWNASGTTFTGIGLNVTDTASAAGSMLMDLQVGGSSRFSVTKGGTLAAQAGSAAAPGYGIGTTGLGIYSRASARINFATSGSDTGIEIGSNLLALAAPASVAWVSSTLPSSGIDLFLLRDAANTLGQRNNVNAQAFNLYNTYTDASNYERGVMRWASSVLQIGAERAGTGTTRAMAFQIDGVTRMTVEASGAVTTAGSLIAGGASGITSAGYLGGWVSGRIGFSGTATLVPSTVLDTYISRSAQGILAITDAAELTEMTAPAAPATNKVRIYAEDNGSGKTRLMALFATGVAQQIAIEP